MNFANEIFPLVFSAEIWYTNNPPPAETLSKRRKAGVKPGLSISCVMKVNVYIDGFNLFYGMLKGTPYKWLDLEKFADGMVAPGVIVVAIKYFTAPIKAYPPNPDKLLRQHFYLEAFSSLSRVRIVEGFYTKHKVRMPFYKEPCLSCPNGNGMASVVKLEEKRSDVNIATEMLLDATLEKDIDAFTLVSGDSDLAGPVSAIRYRLKRPVAVYNPHQGTCDELKRYASLYRNIPHDLPTHCQLPDEVPLADGRTIRRPAAWA